MSQHLCKEMIMGCHRKPYLFQHAFEQHAHGGQVSGDQVPPLNPLQLRLCQAAHRLAVHLEVPCVLLPAGPLQGAHLHSMCGAFLVPLLDQVPLKRRMSMRPMLRDMTAHVRRKPPCAGLDRHPCMDWDGTTRVISQMVAQVLACLSRDSLALACWPTAPWYSAQIPHRGPALAGALHA